MEEIIYNAGDNKSNLELERIIKSEKNLKEIFSFLGRKKLSFKTFEEMDPLRDNPFFGETQS